MLTEFFRWPWICSVCYYLFVLFLQAILLSVVLQIMASDSPCSIFKLFLWLSAWQCRPGLFIYCHLYIFVSCFLVFSIVNSSTISYDTQRGGGARWRHIIQYLRQQNIQDIIIKLTYFHSNSKIKKTLIDVARYKSLIEQSYSCTIRYFDRPDSFCELVTWPTKIFDDTLAFLFNKCNMLSYNFGV